MAALSAGAVWPVVEGTLCEEDPGSLAQRGRAQVFWSNVVLTRLTYKILTEMC